MALKAVLFDWGDTLIHTDRFDYDACLKKMHQSLAKNGIAAPFERFKQEYFNARDRYYRETEKTLKEQDFAQRIAEALGFLGIRLSYQDRQVGDAAEAFLEAFVDSLRIDDYLPRLLERLRSKYKLGIVSNMSFAEAGFRSLRKFDIAQYFDAVVISGVFGWRKPSPRIFQEALGQLGVKAVEAVFVGDSPKADAEGAKQLGMKAILVAERNKKMPLTDTFRLYAGKDTGTESLDRTITELAQLPEALDLLEKNL